MEEHPELRHYSKKSQTGISLMNMMKTGKGDLLEEFEKFAPIKDDSLTQNERVRIQIACFLHRECAVRLAHRAVQLETVPVFKESPHIQSVCNMYKASFADMRRLPVPSTLKGEEQFAKCIDNIYERHASTMMSMAKGANDIRTRLAQSSGKDKKVLRDDIQTALDEFYKSRIGIRILLQQFLELRKEPIPGTIGLIDLHTSVYDIAQRAVEKVNVICDREHGESPVVTIVGREDLKFPYVPSHVEYILMELLKNSMRATIEKHGSDEMPPIKIVIADGEDNEDIAIKVSDEGGGIRRSDMDKCWSYLYTTANSEVLENMLKDYDLVRDFSSSTPLAGLGYGLPIARNYARYFGGDLVVIPMEGYGTDSFIYLPRLRVNADKKGSESSSHFI